MGLKVCSGDAEGFGTDMQFTVARGFLNVHVPVREPLPFELKVGYPLARGRCCAYLGAPFL